MVLLVLVPELPESRQKPFYYRLTGPTGMREGQGRLDLRGEARDRFTIVLGRFTIPPFSISFQGNHCFWNDFSGHGPCIT